MNMTNEELNLQLNSCRHVLPVLSRVGDKWTVLVITGLHKGPSRFNELKRSVTGISQQMLTRTLKALERDGMVIRTTFPTAPPQVQYSLTPLGESLSGPVFALGQWVHDNLKEIELAQHQYDNRANAG